MSDLRLAELASIVAPLVDPRQPEYRDLPLVNGETIESGAGRLRFGRSASDESAISPKYLFRPGDVLYSKLRPYLRKAIVAKVAGLCSADMYPLHVDRARLDPEWLMWHLLGPAFTQDAVQESGRARMPKLNRAQLLSYRFSLPPLDRQRRIAARRREQLGEIDRAKAALEARCAAVEALPGALLQGVFGEGGPA